MRGRCIPYSLPQEGVLLKLSSWNDPFLFFFFDDDVFDDDDNVYYYICERLKLEGETEKMGVCTKERKGVTAEVLMATPCTNSLGEKGWEVKVGGTSMKDVGGAGFAGSSC